MTAAGARPGGRGGGPALPGDYHVHTTWSRTATGSVEECVRAGGRGRPAGDRHRRPHRRDAGAGRGLVGGARRSWPSTATRSARSRRGTTTSPCCSGSRPSTCEGREAELDELLDALAVRDRRPRRARRGRLRLRRAGPARRPPLGRPRRVPRRATTAPCGGRPSTGASTSSPTSTTSACGGTGRGRRRGGARRGARRARRVRRRARAQHRPGQRPGRRHVSVAGHPARGARARHPAGDRLGRARGRARGSACGTRPSRLAREAGYRETLRALRPRARAAARAG